MTDQYFDIRCGDDLDPFARDARPLEVLAQDIYHWLITDPMTLPKAPEWGMGLESYLGRPLPGALAFVIETRVQDLFPVSDARCVFAPVPGEQESYRMTLTCEVEREFLALALQLSPSGIVRVS